MGNGRWDPSDWDVYAKTTVKGKSQAQVFTSRSMVKDYDPAGIVKRESCDSADNPNSTPIILASDVTGSMGMIAHTLMEKGLNTLATEIYDRQPVRDPHIMVMAVGDAKVDRAPLQVTQFEADICLADQVKELWIEGGGGGNGGESYSAAHVFAATKTDIDSLRKRGKKGYLFTIGDEPIHDGMTREEMDRVLGLDMEADLSAAECLAMAQRNWEVYHIVLINEGHCRYDKQRVLDSWEAILPGRTIPLEDVSKLAEVVTSIMQVNEGASKDQVVRSWSGDTSLVVSSALKGSVVPGGNELRRL